MAYVLFKISIFLFRSQRISVFFADCSIQHIFRFNVEMLVFYFIFSRLVLSKYLTGICAGCTFQIRSTFAKPFKL